MCKRNRHRHSRVSKLTAVLLTLMLVCSLGAGTVSAADDSPDATAVTESEENTGGTGGTSGTGENTETPENSEQAEGTKETGEDTQGTDGNTQETDENTGETDPSGQETPAEEEEQAGTQTGGGEEGGASPYSVDLVNGENQTAPEHHKYIAYNEEDGTYTLTLNVTGMYDSETVKPQVDVLLIVDRSGSMSESFGWQSRMSVLKSIVTGQNGLSQAILGNENIDARMAVVSYSGSKSSENESTSTEYWTSNNDSTYNDAWTVQNWTSSRTQLNSSVNRITTGGGTNCEAGLRQGASVLEGARANAQKIVIFLSDGTPTYRYANNDTYENPWFPWNEEDITDGLTIGTGNSDPGNRNAQAAYNQVAAITGMDAFYTIGISSSSGTSFLQTLVNRASAAQKQYYSANSANDLAEVFENIAASVTEYTCRNVTITDTLSEYVQIPEGSTFQAEVIATDSNGNRQDLSGVNIQVTYDESTRTVTADFPDNYTLNQDWTYSISFVVEPSQAAYDAYAQSGYPHTGSAGSDAPGNTTSSNQPGFYSNTEAKLTYTYGTQGAESSTVDYVEKPVVQVESLSIPVEKVWENTGEDDLPDSVTVYLYQDGNTQTPYKTLELTAAQEWKGTFTDVAAGHTYTVGEAELTGFVSQVSGDAENGFTVTNTKLPSLTVSKTVTGEMGDKTRDFTFTITLTGADDTPVSGTYSGVTFTNGTATVSLGDGDSLVLENLPLGSRYTVQETDGDGYTVTYNGEQTEQASGTLNADASVAVVNSRGEVPDTGIRGSGPLTAAVAGAAGAVLLLGGAFAVRLLRRRRY